jgi:hypothetical protein
VDRSQHTVSAVEELRQIRAETRRTESLKRLRQNFERVQSIRRLHVDDFDLQLLIADLHQEIIEKARGLGGDAAGEAATHERDGFAAAREKPFEEAKDRSHVAEIPPEVPRLEAKSWQLAVGLALFLTVLVLAAFFYLIQTARKLNFKAQETAAVVQEQAKAKGQNVSLPAATPLTPTLRLYTDLLPGTLSMDQQPPRDLADGELVLDHLADGQHTIKVAGRSGAASFTFEVAGMKAPRVIGTPSTSNAMTVFVAQAEGRGHLTSSLQTSASGATVLVDGKEAGVAGTEGLNIEAPGETDHNLEVIQERDKQRFVLTPAPGAVLTVFVKSDPNIGTVVVTAGQDGADVYVDNLLYRRKTEHGQVRVPLKVGSYKIRVHKAGFVDPAPLSIDVKKSLETEAKFKLLPAPETQQALLPSPNGTPATNQPETTKPALESKAATENASPAVAGDSGNSTPGSSEPASLNPKSSLSIEGMQTRRGGGFVPYHVPKIPGRYSFQVHGRVGGFLKRGKLQWYAGYQDSENYVLFSLDGKHADIREVRDGKSIERSRVPFDLDSNQWVQIDLGVKADSINARVKTESGGWSEIGSVPSNGHDFTQDKVGVYVPANDEVSIANFRFSGH